MSASTFCREVGKLLKDKRYSVAEKTGARLIKRIGLMSLKRRTAQFATTLISIEATLRSIIDNYFSVEEQNTETVCTFLNSVGNLRENLLQGKLEQLTQEMLQRLDKEYEAVRQLTDLIPSGTRRDLMQLWRAKPGAGIGSAELAELTELWSAHEDKDFWTACYHDLKSHPSLDAVYATDLGLLCRLREPVVITSNFDTEVTVDLGRFYILIPADERDCWPMAAAPVQKAKNSSDARCHPHVENNGHMCIGGLKSHNVDSCAAVGQLRLIIDSAEAALRNYDQNSAYSLIDEWAGSYYGDCCACEAPIFVRSGQLEPTSASTCSDCGDSMHRTCGFVCANPKCENRKEVKNRVTCSNCSRTCKECRETRCTDCCLFCTDCGRALCTNCGLECAHCGEFYCKKHLTKRAGCGHMLCASCNTLTAVSICPVTGCAPTEPESTPKTEEASSVSKKKKKAAAKV